MEFYKQVMEEQPPSGVLYHYTTQSGILGILSNKEIWASKIYYLNDSKEYEHANDLVITFLRFQNKHMMNTGN